MEIVNESEPKGDKDQKKSEPKGEFVAVVKNGESIEIHPSNLEDHIRLGWAVAK